MRRVVILSLLLCLFIPLNIEAKKKPFGKNLYWEVTPSGTLIISGYGDMPRKEFKFKDLEKCKFYPWHKDLKNEIIKEVIIDEGVTSIGKYAFYGLYEISKGVWAKGSIEKVALPRSLKKIDEQAFYNQEKLKTIILNEGLEYIGDLAFSCTGIKSFVMPNSVKTCHSVPSHLEHLVLSENLEEISYMLLNLQDFSSIVIPEKVKRIGKLAFEGCKNLQTVQFPQNLISIGERAFEGCDKLSLSLPDNIQEIGPYAFSSDHYSNTPFKGSIVYLPKRLEKANWNFYGISSEDVKNYYGQVFNNNGKVIIAYKKGRKVNKKQDEYDNSIYYEVDDNGIKGVMEENGKWVINTNKALKQINAFRTYVGRKYYIVSKSTYSGPYGILDAQGRQVVPIEMDGMEYIGGDLIAFRVGSYWGVMSEKGNILVPTSRNYTSIGRYISTQNTFTFTKAGYRGECNGNGKEISLVKVDTPKPSNSTASTSQQQAQKPQPSSNSSSSRAYSTKNSFSSHSSNNDNTTLPKGLRYKGLYTVSSQGRSQTTGGYTGVPGPDFEEEIEIYDDYIMVMSTKYDFDKQSGNERVYSSPVSSFMGTSSYDTYYVDKNYNIRKVSTFNSQFGTDWFEYVVVKGRSTIQKHQPQFGESPSINSGGGNSSNSGGSTYTESGKSTKSHRACTSCKYTNGKCPVCKGSKRVKNNTYGVNSTKTCTNCNASGLCPICGGDGWID